MRLATIAASFLLVVCNASLADALAPLGPPFRVNSFVVGDQGDGGESSCGYGKYRNQSVAADGSQFIVVWQSYDQDGDGDGVFAQRYDASTTPLGGEFQVNQITTGIQTTPVVARAPSGQFVVAWSSNAPYGSGYPLDVFARTFDASGTPLGPEFQVSENVYDLAGYPALRYQSVRNPAIEADASGRFVVAWEREGAYSGSDDGRDIVGRRLDASGAPLGGAFVVSEQPAPPAYGFYWNRTPDVAVKSTGEFVVVWTAIPEGIGGYAVVGRRYDAAGAAQGGEFQVNVQPSYSYNGMSYPVGSYFESTPDATFGGDDFLVTWSSSSMDTGENEDRYDVAGRFFGPTGIPHGQAFRVNTSATYNEGCPSTSRLANGDFVVTWQQYNYTVGQQGFGQVITPSGTKKGVEFPVDSDEASGFVSAMPAVAALGNEFLVAWGRVTPSQWDVYAQRIGEGTGPAATCAPAPMTGCFDTVTPKKSVLTFSRRGGDPAKGGLRWRWKGEATAATDFGTPKFGTGYALCIYDTSANPQPRIQAQVPASGTCGSIPCWRDLGGNVGGSVEYYYGATNDDGVLRMRLDPGATDRNNVSVQGKGVNLNLPSAALSPAVTVQAQARNGKCWSAQFGSFIRKNEANAFSGRSN
jgi:hypothetical protein